jgi:hypothetical protein
MASLADLEAICLALPQVTGEGANFAVGRKALCWPYLARTTPRARREAVPGVLAIRSALETQDMLIAAAPDRFFDDDHYRGYPAVLARLDAVGVDELQGLLRSAWRLQATPALLKAHNTP